MNYNDIIKSPEDNRDFVLKAQKGVKLPKAFTLKSFCRPVRNQGTEGSCSAQVAACVKEVHEAMNEGLKASFSVAYIYSQRVNPKTEGMTPRNTMKLLSEGSLPLKLWRHRYTKGIPKPIKEMAKHFAVSGYARVYDVDSMKQAIWKHGAAYIALPVYNDNTNFALPVYSDNTNFWIEHEGDKLMGGHAMAIIGWNTKGFILRNSWGREWGSDGYTIMPYKDWEVAWEAWFIVDGETADIFKKNGKLIKPERKKLKDRLRKLRKSLQKSK